MENTTSLNTFGETPWHRDWKMAFPKNYREICFWDKLSGHQHRADIHTPCGTTLEFQNSPISLEEMESREAYYPKLIWILNAKKFKGFRILKHLPDINSPRLLDYEFCQSDHLTMIRKKDLSQAIPKRLNFHHPELRNIPLTTCYYSFCWKYPHRVWYRANCPIILDLGGHFLYQLKQRHQMSGNYAYLYLIPRKDFINGFCP
ncbi:competence protein CoiA family protein [Pedobacter sp. GR22-6]|uniref:competence protein CoiA family protein n=1 Tax=Pedobacter sp. GR22-6 TaxID=3127957 RepID=UPI00307F3142